MTIPTKPFPSPFLIGLLDVPRFPHAAWALMPAVLSFADALLLRHKLATPNELFQVARRVRHMVPDTPLWINGPLEVALAIDAEGWHLPAGQMPASAVRAHWSRMLSAAAHTLEEARWHQGADILIWGHAFVTRSKPNTPPRHGLDTIIDGSVKPVAAIGGITPTTAPQLSGRGLQGVVVADGLWMAADPVNAAYRIRHAIDSPGWPDDVRRKET